MNEKWISVEQRLPTPITDAGLTSPLVLVVIEKTRPQCGDTPDVRMAYYHYRDRVWRLAMQAIPAPKIEGWMQVTYWMPLPEPPTQALDIRGQPVVD